MHKLSIRLTVIGLMALFLTLIVSSSAAAQGDTVPAASATPNFPITLKEGLTLDNEHNSETLETPKLTIEVDKPVLRGDAALIENFNTAADKIIEDTAGNFKSDTLTYQTGSDLPPDIAALGSYMDVGYQFFTPTESLLSISFGVDWYSAGAAHPNSYSRTLNYDLDSGTVLALADLFKPDAPFLEALSAYSVKVLTEKGTLMFPDGAQPSDENYQNWNLTLDGLLITFDDYQVAPHVAGPQQVVIPYAELTDLIDPDGVLGPLVTRG
jgi:hypothetical protein